MSLLRKGLINKLLRAFREEEEMALSLMDGFYHLAFTPDGGGGIYCGGSRTCGCQLSAAMLRYKQRELIDL